MSKLFPIDLHATKEIQSYLSEATARGIDFGASPWALTELKDEWAAKGYSRRDINRVVRDGLAELAKVYGN
jgi:hypothetical protein